MNRLLLFGLAIAVISILTPVTFSHAVSQVAIAKHESLDNNPRPIQTFEMKQVEKGSRIDSVYALFNLEESLGDNCVLVLNEPHLNKDVISDQFVCGTSNTVPIKTKGVHALQSKINTEKFSVIIKSITNKNIIAVESDTIQLSIFYSAPTYFANIEDGKVKNVIVAEQSFINTQNGIWVKTDHNTKFAGVGDTYDSNNNRFVSPQPYPSWTLNNWIWSPPVPYPQDEQQYKWNESLVRWELI